MNGYISSHMTVYLIFNFKVDNESLLSSHHDV